MRRSVIIPLILTMGVLTACARGVEGQPAAETFFFSIHVASFQSLENANRHVNNLSVHEKVVFWQHIDVPGKGLFYRVYVGRYPSREEAKMGQDRLKAQGEQGYLGIYRFSDPILVPQPEEQDLAEKPETPPPPSPPKTLTASPPAPPPVPTPAGRFIDNGDGTVTDTQTRLMWTQNGWRLDLFQAVTWDEAVSRCATFHHGGYQNWRLPLLSEWQTLIDPHHEFPALIEPNPFENIIVHQPYWTGSDVSRSPVLAYTVMLYRGSVHRQMKNKRAFVMPVRSLD